MQEVTETHEIKRGGGTLVVDITYTPKLGKPVRMNHLKMVVKSAEGCSSKYVFVYQRATAGAPMEDGSPRDEFIGVADELDEDEIPTEETGPDIANGMPYYRSDSMELLFRNADQMYETAAEVVKSLGL